VEAVKTVETANRLSSVGTMAAGLAHEIKNPLGVINTLIAMLPDKLNDRKYMLNFYEIVPRQIKRMDELVRSLLSYARVNTGKQELLDLQEPLLKALQMIQLSARKDVFIKTSLVSAIISGERQALERCFLNLFLNSLEAMPQGGNLTVILKISKQEAVIQIVDTGQGIAPQQLAHLFEPFFTTRNTGTGLGLYSVANTIQLHQGEIKVKSRVGRGTKFIVKLPIVDKVRGL
jgi:signal transduction histidine kinase